MVEVDEEFPTGGPSDGEWRTRRRIEGSTEIETAASLATLLHSNEPPFMRRMAHGRDGKEGKGRLSTRNFFFSPKESNQITMAMVGVLWSRGGTIFFA